MRRRRPAVPTQFDIVGNIDVLTRLDERYPGAGAGYLVVFAAYTVEGLHYLAEVDAELAAPGGLRDTCLAAAQ